MSPTPRALSCAIQPKGGSVDFQYKVIDAICSLPPLSSVPCPLCHLLDCRGAHQRPWHQTLKCLETRPENAQNERNMRFVLFFTTSMTISPEKLRTKMLRLNLIQLVW